jgi:phosphohistidine phosphatase
MALRIVLVRHAKSAWDDATLADHDRPLAPRGERALEAMRDHVAGLDLPSLLVLCSTATRTAATLSGIRPALPSDAAFESDRSIYYADDDALFDRIARVDAGFESVMVVGHNPTLQDLACTLVGAGDAALREQLATKVPTGSIVTMTFDGPWPVLRAGSAVVETMFMPRTPRT